MFSILIPTWNNLQFLQLCVESIHKNSSFRHQILLHVNDGSDGTLAWARQNRVEYTHSPQNIGICKAVNTSFQQARNDYIVFMNDDMYTLPQWDEELLNSIKSISDNAFMLSSTMIEPYDTHNRCVIVADYGKNVESFAEASLLREYKTYSKNDWSGSTWPPSVVHREWWQKVGGYSEEFSPGMASDDDFARKMWEAGCRHFQGVGKSKVYHFISKSTGRVTRNDGRGDFVRKWGITPATFHKFYTHRGDAYRGMLKEPGSNPLLLLKKLITKF
jgi:GT2 family glycosyltransferase